MTVLLTEVPEPTLHAPEGSGNPLSVLIMAKDPILRAGVERQLLAMPRVALMDRASGRHPDVAVLVADSIDDEVLALIRRVRRLCLSRIVVIAAVTGAAAAGAAAAGASAVIPRPEADYQRVSWAIQSRDRGRSAAMVLAEPSPHRGAPADEGLIPADRTQDRALDRAVDRTLDVVSERDRDVLRLLAEGNDTGEIARRLAYSEPTIKNAIQRLFDQLNTRNRPHLVAVAIRNGVI